MNRADLLSPWEACDIDARDLPALHGLPGYEKESISPGWAARYVMRDAAKGQLVNLAAPTVGAWASYWTNAGLPEEDLLGVLEDVTGSWMHARAQDKHLKATLRKLRRLYPMPDAVDAARPARLTFETDALPVVTDLLPATETRPSPRFVTDSGEEVEMLPGRDVLTVVLPDGLRAAFFIGRSGQVMPDKARGLRCAPDLWPFVESALAGRDPLPEVQAVEVRESGKALLTVALYRRTWTYSCTPKVDVTVGKPEADNQPYRVTLHNLYSRQQKDAPESTAVYFPAHLWATFQVFRGKS